MRTSIIVPHHSNRVGLSYCLRALRQTVPRDVEILVIANNSRISETGAKRASKLARVISVEENLGYSGAINLGAEKASGERLVFCDDDVIPTAGWLERMEAFHGASERVGATAAKLISPFTGRIVDYGIAFTRFNAPHIFQDQLPDHPLSIIRRRVQVACSALMMIDKSLFERVGGFSVARQSHYSDLELCLKINQAGKEVWVLGDVACYHRSSYIGDHRAPYKGSELKGDAKAVFFQEFGDLIEIDLDRYYQESLRSELLKLAIQKNEYFLVSMANVMDVDWYHALFTRLFKISSTYNLPTYRRDAEHLCLMEHLDSNIITKRSPCLYFVDRFVSLRDNAHWFRQRPVGRDLIVDRNGNVVTVSALLGEQAWARPTLRNAAPSLQSQDRESSIASRLREAKVLVARYRNTAEKNDEMWKRFARFVDEIPELRVHRDYVEANGWGFGDRAFHMMWLVLFDEIRSRGHTHVAALEIGVFKGQVLSLWHLIGRLLDMRVNSVGISPLRGTMRNSHSEAQLRALKRVQSYYPDSDYVADIHQIFHDFGLDRRDLTLLQGRSQDDKVRQKIGGRRFDVVYIDGDHRWKFARADIAGYQSLIRKGGYLVVDDAGTDLPGTLYWKGLPSVTKALSAVDANQFENVLNVGHNRVFQRVGETGTHGHGRLRRARK
jgi:GT2 family glycosyltransferase